jgi:preprotein translocase subunit SecG
MEWLQSILIIVQIVAALGVIGLVLIQQGKGADMGAAFGSGASGSIFGAAGSSNFLSRTTAIFATVFFVSTLGITYIGTHKSKDAGVLSAPVTAPAPTEVPTASEKPAANTPKDGSVPK